MSGDDYACDSCGGDADPGSALCLGCAADYEANLLGEYARRGWTDA